MVASHSFKDCAKVDGRLSEDIDSYLKVKKKHADYTVLYVVIYKYMAANLIVYFKTMKDVFSYRNFQRLSSCSTTSGDGISLLYN